MLVSTKEPNLRSMEDASYASPEYECANEIQNRPDNKEETCGGLRRREGRIPGSDFHGVQDHSSQRNCGQREEESQARTLPTRSAADYLRAASGADIRAAWHLCLAVRAKQRLHVGRITEALAAHQSLASYFTSSTRMQEINPSSADSNP